MPFLPIHTEGAEDCFQVASGTSRYIQQLALRVFRKSSPPFSPSMYLFLLIHFASSPSIFLPSLVFIFSPFSPMPPLLLMALWLGKVPVIFYLDLCHPVQKSQSPCGQGALGTWLVGTEISRKCEVHIRFQRFSMKKRIKNILLITFLMIMC